MESETIRVTSANIEHGHIYLRSIIGMFPRSSIGGSNKRAQAKQLLSVTYDGMEAINTDIDGDKLFFRDRSMIKKFFRLKGIRPNDEIVIRKLSEFEFSVKRA